MEKQIGRIGVDAGLCWIGDPCYVLHREEGLPDSLGKNWGEFCDLIGSSFQHKSFGYQAGHEGLGVCVATGYGDGSYPVYAEINEEGRVTSVRIVFVEEEEESDQYGLAVCQNCGYGVDPGEEYCEECSEEFID